MSHLNFHHQDTKNTKLGLKSKAIHRRDAEKTYIRVKV
jgi:hypothetical protein